MAKGSLADLDVSVETLAPLLDRLHGHLQAKRHALPARGGSHTVVLAPELAGMLAHEAMGHPCEADLVLGGAVTRDLLGQRVASALVTMIDVAHHYGAEEALIPAVSTVLAWLHGQLGDAQLIAGSSRYRNSVGQPIASALLNVRSRFDAPGVAGVSSDGFLTPPVEIVRNGRLLALLPTLYGSRKTGLAHVPVADAGWEVEAGETTRAEMLAGVARGALVGRLSMGSPAANGDFSGVIKNSFAIVDGAIGAALSEAMIIGNMARMLQDIVAVSRERIDTGALRLPWIRIANLHFS